MDCTVRVRPLFSRAVRSIFVCGTLACTWNARAQIQPSGEIHTREFTLPYTSFASDVAREKFVAKITAQRPEAHDVDSLRAFYGIYNGRLAQRMRQIFAVETYAETWNGVKVMRVVPAGGVKSAHRHQILISLHGGAFMWGNGAGEEVEAIPVAATEGIEVVSVDYRLAPEFPFPAAIDDVTQVYRHLLARYPAKNVGMYGCSAGAIIASESVTHFLRLGLPVPGALGTFCGALKPFDGDSVYMSPPSVKEAPYSPQSGNMPANAYFDHVDQHSADAFAANSSDLLKSFPPTLLLTGTRDQAFSSTIASEVALHAAGVPTEMHVWDGMWHAFFVDPDLPESREAYGDIARFFDRTLAAGPMRKGVR